MSAQDTCTCTHTRGQHHALKDACLSMRCECARFDGPPAGMKHDHGKDRWELLPVGPVRSIVKVLTFGVNVKKYPVDNWQLVDDAKNRYYAAALRHLTSWRDGEVVDPESDLPHLAHAGCCLLFLLWLEAKS